MFDPRCRTSRASSRDKSTSALLRLAAARDAMYQLPLWATRSSRRSSRKSAGHANGTELASVTTKPNGEPRQLLLRASAEPDPFLQCARWLLVWLVGTCVGVSWATLPAYAYTRLCTGDHCWLFVGAQLGASLTATFLFPALVHFAHVVEAFVRRAAAAAPPPTALMEAVLQRESSLQLPRAQPADQELTSSHLAAGLHQVRVDVRLDPAVLRAPRDRQHAAALRRVWRGACCLVPPAATRPSAARAPGGGQPLRSLPFARCMDANHRHVGSCAGALPEHSKNADARALPRAPCRVRAPRQAMRLLPPRRLPLRAAGAARRAATGAARVFA